jgi:hypothetical protein
MLYCGIIALDGLWLLRGGYHVRRVIPYNLASRLLDVLVVCMHYF